jgi:hypothetical protein
VERARIVQGWELAGKPWEEKIRHLIVEARLDGHGILFVDNVSRAAGIEDEGGVEFGRAVEQLADACRSHDIALLFDVHHKKGRDSIENKSRGGTAVPGAVEVNVEIVRVGGHGSRKRKLTAFGRVQATNWERVIELAADGTSYTDADDEPSRADRTEADLLAAMWKLRNYPDGVTVKTFQPIIGLGEKATRSRLKELADAGYAEVIESVTTGKGRTPTVYKPVAPLADRSEP